MSSDHDAAMTTLAARLAAMDDAALGEAITAVASGVSKPDTDAYLTEHYPGIGAPTRQTILHDARIEAENQGIEREDIDASWYR